MALLSLIVPSYNEQQNIESNIPPESHPNLPEQPLDYSCCSRFPSEKSHPQNEEDIKGDKYFFALLPHIVFLYFKYSPTTSLKFSITYSTSSSESSV